MQSVAVIGLSCLFPEANTPAEYWQNLLQGKNTCTSATESNLEAEPSRFFADKKGVADKFYCARGGYIRDFSLDAEGFLLPAETIEKLGETFQWPLHVAREALRDSGYADQTEILKKCGVVLGNLSFPTKASNHLLLPLYQNVLDPLLKKALNRSDFSLNSFTDEKNYALKILVFLDFPHQLSLRLWVCLPTVWRWMQHVLHPCMQWRWPVIICKAEKQI